MCHTMTYRCLIKKCIFPRPAAAPHNSSSTQFNVQEKKKNQKNSGCCCVDGTSVESWGWKNTQKIIKKKIEIQNNKNSGGKLNFHCFSPKSHTEE